MAAPQLTGSQVTGSQVTGSQVTGSHVSGSQIPASARQLTGPPFPWRYLAAAALLAAGEVWWAAAPVSGAGAGTRIALIIAIITGTASLGHIAVAAAPSPVRDDNSRLGRIAAQLVALVRMLAWPELMTVAVLTLEALHRSRPWHTAVLGAAIVGFLLAAHLTESRADISVLRRQLPLVGLGLGLSALAVGAAALPSLPTGGVSAVVRIVAATAGVLAAGLAVPVWLSRRR